MGKTESDHKPSRAMTTNTIARQGVKGGGKILAGVYRGTGRVVGSATRKTFGPGKHQRTVADAAERLDTALAKLTAALRQRDGRIAQLERELEVSDAKIAELRAQCER